MLRDQIFYSTTPIGDERVLRRDRPEHGGLDEQAGKKLSVAGDAGRRPDLAGGEVGLD